MSGNFDLEQWQNFNRRLSYWISKQGFWFQLRHSLPGGGRQGSFVYDVVHLFLRLFLFVAVSVVICAMAVRFLGKERFAEHISQSLQQKFAAEDIDVQGVIRKKGKFTITRVAMISEQGSFFKGLEVFNLVCPRGLFVDYGRPWKTGIVEISKVNLSLRAGADTDEGAKAIGDVLFQDLGEIKPDAIHVAQMSMKWGYNQRSRGAIQNSFMKALPTEEGWHLSFTGGTFSQNWMKSLEIEKLELLITRQGIHFEEAIFSKNGGKLILEQCEVLSGGRPIVTGRIKMNGVEISSMLPQPIRPFLDGKISGEFEIDGSTNTTEGIAFNGEIHLKDGDVLSLNDKIPLLRALSVADGNASYRRVDFRVGSLRLESKEKGLMFSNVNLQADELLTLKGDMFVRMPKSDEEIVLDDGSDFFGEIIKSDEFDNEVKISLREVTGVSGQQRQKIQNRSEESIYGKLAYMSESRLIKELEAEKMSRSYRYEGEFQITLRKSAFERAPMLRQEYPATVEGERIPIDVPIQGLLYEITSDLASQFYEKGRRQ